MLKVEQIDSAMECTLHIMFRDNSKATAFMIKFADRKFLVTAGHVVNGINETDIIYIFREERWTWYEVSLVHLGNSNRNEPDIAILEVTNCDLPILRHDFSNDTEKSYDLVQTEKVYVFGFPLGLNSNLPETFQLVNIDSEIPMPFVKEGIVSSFGHLNNQLCNFFIDAHINRGFSGGPAFVVRNNELDLAGIVTAYIPEQIAHNVSGNSGIAVCTYFSSVLEVLNNIYFQM